MKNIPVGRLLVWYCLITLSLCLCACSMKFDPNGTAEPTADASLVEKVQQDVESLKQTFKEQAAQAQAAGDTKAAETFTKAATAIETGQQKAAQYVKTNADGTLDLAAMATAIPVYGPWLALALTGYKWWQSSNAGKSIVRHLDSMISSDPAVKAALKQLPEGAKANARALLTPAAAKLIDNVSVT